MNDIISKIKSNALLTKITPLLDCNTYIVGGFLRDCFFGKISYDIDLVVENNQAEELAKRLAKHLDAHFVTLDVEHGIYRVVMSDKQYYFDVANLVGGSIESDLSSRDLTINALALRLNDFELIDICGGLDDLKSGVIRCINEDNFKSDPLRTLRVFRFQSILGFKIEPNTLELAEKYSSLLNTCAKERQKQELTKLFNGKYAHDALFALDKTGMLDLMLPEYISVKTIPPNSHHHLDLFAHSIETMRNVHKIYNNSSEEIKQHLDKCVVEGVSRLAMLKLSAFLHDIGKPETWIIEADTGRHRFIKHDIIGSLKVVPLLKEFRFAKKHIVYVQNMVRNHIYPSTLFVHNESSDKAKMRFVRKMKEDAVDITILAMADRLSARGEAVTEKMVNDNILNLNSLLDFYFNNKHLLSPLQRLLDGNEIMAMFGLKPSKKLGELLDKLHQAQIDGLVNSKQEAVNFVEKLV